MLENCNEKHKIKLLHFLIQDKKELLKVFAPEHLHGMTVYKSNNIYQFLFLRKCRQQQQVIRSNCGGHTRFDLYTQTGMSTPLKTVCSNVKTKET